MTLLRLLEGSPNGLYPEEEEGGGLASKGLVVEGAFPGP